MAFYPAVSRVLRRKLLYAARTARHVSSLKDARLHVAVVGGGRMGVIRAECIYGNLATKLSCVVDSDPDGGANLAGFHAPLYSSLEEALQAARVDAIWIATPTPSHKALIALAAATGKAVAVEKPVAANVPDILESYAVCEAAGVPLFCSFQRRIDTSYVDMARSVHAGVIGKPHTVKAVFRDHPVPPLAFLLVGGDIFHDLAVHDVDYVRWLLQEDPCEVFAITSSQLPELAAARVADVAHALFRFPSGAIFTLEMTRGCAYGYDNRIEVAGADGMLELLNKPRTDVVFSSKHGRLAARPDHSFPQRFAGAFADEVTAFARVVRGWEAPLVGRSDSARATHIAEMASQSARLGRMLPIEYNF